jgi:hypothetical protein
VTARTNEFVRGLLASQIDEEIGGLYKEAKKTLNLSARNLAMDSGDGDGNLDCTFFRYSIEGRQDPEDAGQYLLVRRLELREGWEDREEEIDNLFGTIFDSLVVEIDADGLNFDTLVELFEGIESAHGGNLDEDRRSKRIEYAAADGTRIMIDVGEGRLALSKPSTSSCSELVDIARQYRFTLDGPSRLLLASA